MKSKDPELPNSELIAPNSELERLKADLAKKDSELKSLQAELQKTKERERDFEEARKAMLYMLEDICESERRYKTVIQTSMDGFWLMDAQERVLDVNDAYCRLTGYTRDELLTMRIQDIETMEKPEEETAQRIQKIMERGYDRFETRHRCKDGRIVDIEVSVAYHALADGQFFAFIRDVTERKRVENVLRESEERYRLVTELTSDFIFKIIVTPDGQMVFESITQKITDITGYSPDDIKTPDGWQRIAHADDRQVLDGFFKAILKGQPKEGKLRIVTKSGEVKWFRIFGRPLRDEHKRRITGIIGAGKDITEYLLAEEERKRLQGELVEKERFLEAVLQQMPVGVIVAEAPSGKLYLSNRKVAELLRHPFYPSATVEQYVQYKGFHPDGRQYMPEEWPIALSVKTGEVVEGEEIDYLRGDGSHCWIKVYSGPISNEKGQITGAIASFFDVTERKQALERVEKLNTLLISLRKINEALVRSKDEVALFHVICDSLTGVGFVRFAWIGLLEEGSIDIKPIAHAGFEDGFLSAVTLRRDDAGYSMSPAGIAVKTGKPCILTDIAKDQMNEEWRSEALKRGYKACVALPLKYDEKGIGVFVVFSGTKEAISEEEIGYLQEVATDISVGIKSRRLERELQQSYERIRKTLKGTIDAIANICEKRDPYTSGHEKRVAQLACAIAGEMGLSEDQVEGIRATSCLHDIGKMEVPAEILSKPTRLTNIEFSLIKAHSQTGYEILKGVEFPWPVAQIILQHQERLDGSGYPNGLKGKEIMLEARILAVADTVEAMSSHRPYRPALGLDTALKEITQKKGILYDPAVVDACLMLFRRKRFQFR
jgi:PAS domain S-box-containing protein/putative nucleotidyltransferase with HDIG domain